ncbi:response regulator [Arthrobacter sp. NyZ413]|uniref:response regulator n=1 Tax=Arthrobacter sp. NyZ413 TaxID=3144669 RepID=UPI003BF78657
MPPFQIFIVSGNVLLRQGLKELCESNGLEVAGEGASAREALKLISRLNPTVAIIEDILQDGTGIEVSRDVQNSVSSVHCLLLTGWDQQKAERAAVLAGATGYVFKQARDAAGLVGAIRAAASGDPLLGPDARQRAAKDLLALSSSPWLRATPQEREVLALMSQGLTNRQITLYSQLTAAHVSDLVSSVLLKLGIGTSRTLTAET